MMHVIQMPARNSKNLISVEVSRAVLHRSAKKAQGTVTQFPYLQYITLTHKTALQYGIKSANNFPKIICRHVLHSPARMESL